jgi:hypothetical protein
MSFGRSLRQKKKKMSALLMEEEVRKFCDLTGAESETAKVYLEKFGWNLNNAVDQFFASFAETSTNEDGQTNASEEDVAKVETDFYVILGVAPDATAAEIRKGDF